MNNHIWIFIGFFLFPILAIAQHSVSGTVKDDQDSPLFFATVALYELSDSTIVNAASTDIDGQFELTDIKDGEYFVEVSMIGFTAFRRELIFPADAGIVIPMALAGDTQVLETVEVVGRTPLLEQKSDRLVVNLENSITSLNGTLLDAMKQVPGMIVINGNLSLAGQSNVTILLNGKSTKYMDIQSLLRDMPGDNIKKVEIIHQPGAEFEAEGSGPIINILLKKNSLMGTNGSATLSIGKGRFWEYNGNVTLSHYENNLNINGSLGYSRPSWQDQLFIDRRIGQDVYTQHTTAPVKPQSLVTSLSVDWDATDHQQLGLASRYINGRIPKVIENQTTIDFFDSAENDLRLSSLNNSDKKWNLLSVNPYYSYIFDAEGQRLDADISWIRYERAEDSQITTEEFNVNEFYPEQKYDQTGITQIGAAKLDYTLPFSEALQLQLGTKYSFADLDNEIGSFFQTEEGIWEENLQQSNHYLFEEKIGAVYGKLDFNFGKWSGTAGLRYEDSQSEGYSVTLDSTINRHFRQFFPSFSLSNEVSNTLTATLAYSYRIDRPEYATLNPFLYYIDPFTFRRGNPLLTPALTHSMKFNLAYEGQPFFNVEYKLNENAMVEVTEQNDETGEASYTTINLDAYNVFSSSLYFPLDFIPHLSGYGGVIAQHAQYESNYLDQVFDRSRWTFTAFLRTSFPLPWDMTGELSGWYNSGSQEGLLNSEWLYSVSGGIGKKFLDGKLKVNLSVEDIFNRFYYADIRYANMNANVRSTWDTPFVNLKLSYKFGNQHLKESEDREASASEELNRVNN